MESRELLTSYIIQESKRLKWSDEYTITYLLKFFTTVDLKLILDDMHLQVIQVIKGT